MFEGVRLVCRRCGEPFNHARLTPWLRALRNAMLVVIGAGVAIMASAFTGPMGFLLAVAFIVYTGWKWGRDDMNPACESCGARDSIPADSSEGRRIRERNDQ